MAEKYDKLEIIGSGTYGRAWLVRRKTSDKKYVMKEIKLTCMTETEREQALTEIKVLSKCKHLNVTRYREAFVDKEQQALEIVMEYADGGDLQQKILNQKGIHFEEKVIMDWFIQICFALRYIHGLKILHRDLKAQNVFLTSDNVIKVGDFGISRVLQATSDCALTVIGTPVYLSPEICQRQSYNQKSDIWALGCVLYNLCCLNMPFEARDFTQLVMKIMRGEYKPIPNHYSDTVHDLIDTLLHVDPARRPTAEQILCIPALGQGVDGYVSRCKYLREKLSTPSPVVTSSGDSAKRKRGRIGKENVNPVGNVKSQKPKKVAASTNPGLKEIGSVNRPVDVNRVEIKFEKNPAQSLFKGVIPSKDHVFTPPVPIQKKDKSGSITNIKSRRVSDIRMSEIRTKIRKSAEEMKAVVEHMTPHDEADGGTPDCTTPETCPESCGLARKDTPRPISFISDVSLVDDERPQSKTYKVQSPLVVNQSSEDVFPVSCARYTNSPLPKGVAASTPFPGNVATDTPGFQRTSPIGGNGYQAPVNTPEVSTYKVNEGNMFHNMPEKMQADSTKSGCQYEVCKYMYSVCCTGQGQVQGHLDMMQAFLEGRLGVIKFRTLYNRIRQGRAEGQSFEEVYSDLTWDLLQYMPLLLWMVNLEIGNK